jgi:cytochrome c553
MRRIERIAVAIVATVAGLTTLAVMTGLLRPPDVASATLASFAGIEAPAALNDPAMIRRGAAHYDRVCAACHGSPDRPEGGTALEFSPPAPTLHLRLGSRAPEALFLTVKHGVSGTAMPAWPTPHRDDEVWDMVAFLQVLPELQPQAYRELARSGARAADPLVSGCARCHGPTGQGLPDGAFPRLDIQSPQYLRATLEAYRAGNRASGFMQSVAAQLDDAEIEAVANHFAKEAAETVEGTTVTSLDAPCSACHTPDLSRPEFPRLVGQYRSYADKQLELFRVLQEHRGGTPFVGLMHEVVRSSGMRGLGEAEDHPSSP